MTPPPSPRRGAESEIHGPRDDITTPVGPGEKECPSYSVGEAGRIHVGGEFRLMFLLSDIEPGGGGLQVRRRAEAH
jgi:hypothetical protein